MRAAAITLIAVAALQAAPAASAAQRYASPTSTRFLGDCPKSSPCRIDHAVENAQTGDLVRGGASGDW